MRLVAVLLIIGATSASAQDSSFSVLRLRAGLLRLPVTGDIRPDWRPRTGGQLDVASNVGASEISLAASHLAFESTTGKPPFTETMFSLAWTRPVVRRGSFGVAAGARLTDVRMDFDDPSLVGGLRTEEEQLISALGRAGFTLGGNYSGFVETTYGVLMTSTRTPTATCVVGVERAGAMPRWLRDFLR
jgi:hypothetical protein